jgi:hypothetical protein
MASKPGEITEEEVALIAVQVGAERSDGIVSYDDLREEVPRRYNLSASDLMQSVTRPSECVWEQKIRNIKSHCESPGNYIHEGYLEHVPSVGYRITARGRGLAQRYAA